MYLIRRKLHNKEINIKVAICFSGYPNSLKYTYKNLLSNFKRSFGSFDIFAYIPKCKEAYQVEKYFRKYLRASEIKEDEFLSEDGIGDNNLKTGIQKYLQQIYAYKKVNELRIAFESKNNFKYDAVVRCRFDIRFVSPIPKISEIDLSGINIPRFHAWRGYNDRFAIGSSSLMDIYFNVIESRYKSPEKLNSSAEAFLKYHLDKNKVLINLINVEANRILANGVEKVFDTGKDSIKNPVLRLYRTIKKYHKKILFRILRFDLPKMQRKRRV